MDPAHVMPLLLYAGGRVFPTLRSLPGNAIADALARFHVSRRPHRMHSMPSPPAVFIVGSPRSGTTLLRMMLDSHPELAIPPETGFIPHALRCIGGTDASRRRAFCETLANFPVGASAWADHRVSRAELLNELKALVPFQLDQAIRCFYKLYAARFGKTRWGDKTPTYGLYAPAILRLLPEASFVHIVRDGRDVALSLRDLWFAPGRDMTSLARQWRRDVRVTRRLSQRCPRYMEVRYESLVRQTEIEIRRICEFIELEYHPAMLRYHERAPARLSEHAARIHSDGRILSTAHARFTMQQLTTAAPDSSRISRWKTTPRFCGGPTTDSPPTRISPPDGRSRPARHRNNVLFPQPLGPSTLRNSASPIFVLMP